MDSIYGRAMQGVQQVPPPPHPTPRLPPLTLPSHTFVGVPCKACSSPATHSIDGYHMHDVQQAGGVTCFTAVVDAAHTLSACKGSERGGPFHGRMREWAARGTEPVLAAYEKGVDHPLRESGKGWQEGGFIALDGPRLTWGATERACVGGAGEGDAAEYHGAGGGGPQGPCGWRYTTGIPCARTHTR